MIQAERYVWSPKHGGCIMLQRRTGAGWVDWSSLHEGEFPTRESAAHALARGTGSIPGRWSTHDPKPKLTRREELEGLGMLLFICGIASVLCILAATCAR